MAGGSDNTPVVGTMDAGTGFFGEKGLQLSYHLPEEGNHPRIWVGTRFSAQDWSDMDYLTYWVKIEPGSVGDSLSTAVFDTKGNKLIRIKLKEIPEGWYKVSLPLEDFNTVDLSDIVEVRVYIEGIYQVDGTGMLTLGALYLEKETSVLDVTTAVVDERLVINISSPYALRIRPKVRVVGGDYLEVVELDVNRCQATYVLAGEEDLTFELLVPGNPTHVVEWSR